MDYTEGRIAVSGGEMEYIRCGRGGKTLVGIAGMSMAGLTGLGAGISATYEEMADDYTMVFLDRVEPLPEGYTVRQMADDAAEAMRRLGIACADVMGASQGGMIALYLAIDHPKLVRSLVLASSCAYLDEGGKAVMRHWRTLAEKNDGRACYRDFFERGMTRSNWEALKLVENTATPEQCRRYAILAHACEVFDCRKELPRVQCPVLVLTAENDRVLGHETAEETARLLNCDCYVYAGYGHTAYDEAPDYRTRLLAFYNSI